MILLSMLFGLGLLLASGEMLVRSSSRLAINLGISPLLVGLTIVAIGTSAPEFAVIIQSSQIGASDVVLGNIIGSNIANILLIIGTSILIRPISLSLNVIRRDIYVMISTSIIFWVMALDGEISGYDGSLLFLMAVGYLLFITNAGLEESKAAKKEYENEVLEEADVSKNTPSDWRVDGALLIASLIVLVYGAELLVSGAISLAHVIGISEFIIALTIVAVGTSLPELTASALASARDNGQIVVGNVVGSNIFNILMGISLASLVAPAPMAVSWQARLIDFPIMVGSSLLCLRLFNRGVVVGKRDGKVLLGAYGIYVTLQIVLSLLI